MGAAAAHAAARAAWSRGQPAVVSTHRVSYAHLDGAWSEAGRAALRDLLGRLMGDNALFLTDAGCGASSITDGRRARSGCRARWSAATAHPRRGELLAVPPGTDHVAVREGCARGRPLSIENGHAVAWLTPGEYLVEWKM